MAPDPVKPVVLVVEDEFITGSDLQSTLSDMGYEVPFVVDTGEEALIKAGEMHPDIILMDITLRGAMSGIDAAEQIRQKYGIPVIFLTAHSDETTIDRAKITGPAAYIVKPFEPRNLRTTIEMARYKHAIDRQLHESEAKYHAFVRNFLGIAFRLKADFTPVFLKGAIESITGYTEEEFVAGTITWEGIIDPEDLPVVREQNRYIGEQNEYSGKREYRILRRDNEIKWIFELIQKVQDSPGSPPYIQGSCYDITDRKNDEMAIRIANNKLNLLNNITRHDILNTLHGLLGLVEMAEESITDPGQAEILALISRSTKKIQQQITFTRNYQDVGVKTPQWQNLCACIGSALSTVDNGRVAVADHIDPSIEIFADPLLEKVFYNLVDNAIRYGGTITELNFSAVPEHRNLLIICEDNGEGIVDTAKEQIFLQGVGKNTGMGLFLSREILMITSVSIRESGVAGMGARFEIVVPNGMWRRVKTEG
jgi:PAS domain S-box-containing protein